MIGIMSILGQLFTQPLNVPTSPAGLLWSLPICLAIAMVYKGLKLEKITPALFIKEVTLLFLTIIGVLILVAILLILLAYWVDVI